MVAPTFGSAQGWGTWQFFHGAETDCKTTDNKQPGRQSRTVIALFRREPTKARICRSLKVQSADRFRRCGISRETHCSTKAEAIRDAVVGSRSSGDPESPHTASQWPIRTILGELCSGITNFGGAHPISIPVLHIVGLKWRYSWPALMLDCAWPVAPDFRAYWNSRTTKSFNCRRQVCHLCAAPSDVWIVYLIPRFVGLQIGINLYKTLAWLLASQVQPKPRIILAMIFAKFILPGHFGLFFR